MESAIEIIEIFENRNQFIKRICCKLFFPGFFKQGCSFQQKM